MWKAYGASKTAGISVLPTMAPYLSPEVTEGAMPSPRSDIYALGVLMFEMLTGRYPFSADTPIAMALKHTTAPVPSLKLANPGVPAVLEEIVKKCMSKVPHDRYLDARALSSDLRVLQDALRFGKSISWPIGKGSTVSDASPPPGPQVVAPRMSAITKERKENADKNSAPAEDFEYGDTATKILSVLAYLLLLVIIVMIGAWAFTNLMGQKKVRVPNVIGRNAATVSKDFKDLHLKMQTESTESDKPEGTILSTDPADGIKVDENSVVLARISTGSKFVEIPDSILGIEENEAKDLLSKIGLKVKVVRGPSKNVAEGTVFDVRPKPRQKLKKGTDVKLYVSNGERGSTGTDRGERAHYTVKFRLNTEQSVQVQIDVVDSSGIPRSIFDRRVFPLNLVDAECDARGDEVLFKIYYNGELVHQVTSKPTGAKNQDDTSTTGDEPSPNGVDTRDAPPPSENQ
jgi:serine/threonine-protein kinase